MEVKKDLYMFNVFMLPNIEKNAGDDRVAVYTALVQSLNTIKRYCERRECNDCPFRMYDGENSGCAFRQSSYPFSWNNIITVLADNMSCKPLYILQCGTEDVETLSYTTDINNIHSDY